MWLMTTTGFVSIVQKAEDQNNGTLTVRARDAASLEAFAEAAGRAPRKYKTDIATDYPYRDVFTRVEVGNALLVMVETLTYSNFKNAAKAMRGEIYAKALNNVWWDMQDLTPKKIKSKIERSWRSYLADRPSSSTWSAAAAHELDVLEPDELEFLKMESDEDFVRIGDMTDEEWAVYSEKYWGK